MGPQMKKDKPKDKSNERERERGRVDSSHSVGSFGIYKCRWGIALL